MISILKTFPDRTVCELSLQTARVRSLDKPGRTIEGEEIAAVSAAAKAPADFLAAALDPEETSRIESDEGYVLVVINVPKVEGNFRFDAIPMGIIA